MPVLTRVSLQRVLEAEENKDGFHDDEEFELDTPKRKNRNRNKVSVESTVKPVSEAAAEHWNIVTQQIPRRFRVLAVLATGLRCLSEQRIQSQKSRTCQH